jgi:hypothetical protein
MKVNFINNKNKIYFKDHTQDLLNVQAIEGVDQEHQQQQRSRGQGLNLEIKNF